jgi:hypothetical protein
MALIRVRAPARGFLVVNKAIFGVSGKDLKRVLFVAMARARLIIAFLRHSPGSHSFANSQKYAFFWHYFVPFHKNGVSVALIRGRSVLMYTPLHRLFVTNGYNGE